MSSTPRPGFFSWFALLIWFIGLMLLAVFPISARELPAPARLACSSRSEAYAASTAYASAHGGRVVITSGTPSMEPLIHGQTYAVIEDRVYAEIQKYDLLVYMGRPDASRPERQKMLHRAVKGDAHGWMMSGDNNRWTESWDRVTPQTYLGMVVALFAFPNSSRVAVAETIQTVAVSR